jgi:hypothetical protein
MVYHTVYDIWFTTENGVNISLFLRLINGNFLEYSNLPPGGAPLSSLNIFQFFNLLGLIFYGLFTDL